MKTFKEIVEKTLEYPVKTLAVVEAGDETVLSAIKRAYDTQLAKAILFGRKEEIIKKAKACEFPLNKVTIRDTKDEISSAREASTCVREGKADILM